MSLTVRDVEGHQERSPSRDLVGQDGLDALGSGTPIRWLCTPRSTGSADERMLLHSRPHTTVAALLRSIQTFTFGGVDGPPGWERFDSCWARLDRAAEHLHAFGEAWAAFLADDPYRVFVEVNDDGSGVVGIRRERPFPQRLPLLIGEFLYELRATLDNCLYEVAVIHSGQNPPTGASQLQFPIYSTPADWGRNVYRLKHLSDEHRQMLERIQPYQAQRRGLNCLGMVRELVPHVEPAGEPS